MNSDEQLAQQEQDQEYATMNSSFIFHNTKMLEENVPSSFEIANIMQEEEQDIASQTLAWQLKEWEERKMNDANFQELVKVVQQEDDLELSHQLALKLQQEEDKRLAEANSGIGMLPSNRDLGSNNNSSLDRDRREHFYPPHIDPDSMMDFTDGNDSEDNFGAVAAAPLFPSGQFHGNNKEQVAYHSENQWEIFGAEVDPPALQRTQPTHHCHHLAADEQLAKRFQEEENEAKSLELAMKLQQEEEDKATKRFRHRLHNQPRPPNFRVMVNDNGSQLQNLMAAPSMRLGWSRRPPPRQHQHGFGPGLFSSMFGQPDRAFMDPDDDETPALLLPPGLENFFIQGDQPFDFIPVPENSNYEELLALSESLGDVSCGLTKVQVGRLPTKRWSSGSRSANKEDDQCSICLSEYIDNDEVRTLPCLHGFHKNCIDPWLKDKTSCPTCRADVKKSKK